MVATRLRYIPYDVALIAAVAQAVGNGAQVTRRGRKQLATWIAPNEDPKTGLTNAKRQFRRDGLVTTACLSDSPPNP